MDSAARSSARAHRAAEVSPSASRTPTAVLVDLAGEEASVRKVWTDLPSAVPDPDSWPQAGPSAWALMYAPGPPQSLPTQPVVTRAPAVPSLPLTCVPLTTTRLFPACAPGHFGADCRLQCQCRNGGTCDRFSGCVCPSGWHGMHCEKSGTRVFEIPQNKSAFTRHISPWLQVLCSGSSGFRGCSHCPAHITHAGLGSSPEWVGTQRRPPVSLRGSERASGEEARSEVGYKG